MSQILVELVKLANLIINISKALACANRISGIFAQESSIKEKQDCAETGPKETDLAESTPRVDFPLFRARLSASSAAPVPERLLW